MPRTTTYYPQHASQGVCMNRSASGSSSSSEAGSSSSRRLSLTCPNCRTPFLDIPADILEIEEENAPEPTQPKRWAKRPVWISRPLNRKNSEASTVAPGPMDEYVYTSQHRRRASISSVVSDSSSQTKVEPSPALRSILSHSPSVSSGKDSGSTLTAKRSVKFSDEPVYYDYSYRFSHICEYGPCHAVHCKLGEDCNGECLFDNYTFDYDVDMFSFEQPEDIPSEKRWGLFSRFIAWLRRRTGRRAYTIEEGKRRPVISRPAPLTPRSTRHCTVRGPVVKDGRVKKLRKPVEKVWKDG